MHDLIIIGAGPAGLTAALYAGRSRLETLVLEKMACGGRILTSETIENYPGFPGGISTEELMKRISQQVESLGVKIFLEEAVELDLKAMRVKTTDKEYSAKAMIIASGAIPRKLNVPGEDKLTGRGVSYCATCDGPFYKDKDVIVVGGGNAVAEEAIYLSRFAKKINIVHRRDQLRASMILLEEMAKNTKINFTLSSVITEICGANKVEGVKIKNVTNGKETNLACDGVFIYIGYDPDTGLVNKQLQLDESGFIITQEDMSTSILGVFACGDCRKKSLYQVINACGDGAIAADSAYKFISKL